MHDYNENDDGCGDMDETNNVRAGQQNWGGWPLPLLITPLRTNYPSLSMFIMLMMMITAFVPSFTITISPFDVIVIVRV